MPTDVDLLGNLEEEIRIRTMACRRNLFAPLDERQALVWRAHAIDGLALDAVASVLGMPLAECMVTYTAARQAIYEMVRSDDHVPSVLGRPLLTEGRVHSLLTGDTCAGRPPRAGELRCTLWVRWAIGGQDPGDVLRQQRGAKRRTTKLGEEAWGIIRDAQRVLREAVGPSSVAQALRERAA